MSTYSYPNEYAPYTWEACVVKISDKISYIGRDIEDAITLGILDNHLDDLYKLIHNADVKNEINNTIIINYLVSDLCENSSPEKGLCFSDEAFSLLNQIKQFNYDNIYNSNRILPSNRYFELVISEIYNTLKNTYDGNNTLNNLNVLSKSFPKLSKSFISFINNYYDFGNRDNLRLKNKVIFNIENPNDYYKCILYYISGMTDNFAIEIYNEIIRF